jgi:hypothetical protein
MGLLIFDFLCKMINLKSSSYRENVPTKMVIVSVIDSIIDLDA